MLRDAPVKIYALGGLGEIGKNTYCFETDRSIILVDAGVRFPEATLPGVDYVIPDYTYLKNNRPKLKALFITHGHEDHIGGIPFLLRMVSFPVIYAPRLAAALIRHKLEDSHFKEPVTIVEYDSNTVVPIGEDFLASFFRVTHSIPDSYGICIDTKQGRIVESGDFKIDLTPVGPRFEIDKLAKLGSEGIDLLMADSTNAEIEGYTPSETNVRAGVEEIFEKAQGRIIVSTFSSNINRIQQVVEVAQKHGRKFCIMGRSMKNVIAIAREYGYIKIEDKNIIDETMLRNYKMKDICIVCTGSQGEPMAALSRIVSGDNPNTSIYPGDTIIFSSNPIPGNGALVDRLVNKLVKMGADVKQNSLAFSLHSSGHPSRQELRLMQRLTQPKNFMPVHGEYRMLKFHGQIAVDLGMPAENVFVCENGDVLQLYDHKITHSGHVPADDVYIDGKDLDGLSTTTMSDRAVMKSDGLVNVVINLTHDGKKKTTDPIVYTRGFAASEQDHVVRHSKMRAEEALQECFAEGRYGSGEIKARVRNTVSKYIERRTDRKPAILVFVLYADKQY